MHPGWEGFSAPAATSEGQFPLGPFPRHTWIHSNTPEDSLDKACHKIWQRVQRHSEELSALPLQHSLCPDLPETLRGHSIDFQSNNYLLEEPEGLESIYRAAMRNREREMKLKALCDAQLSAKSATTSVPCSAKPHKNSRRLKDGSVTGTRSTEGSKTEVAKSRDTAKDARHKVKAEDKKVMESTQNSTFSSVKSNSAAVSATAVSQAAGQKQQLLPLAKMHSQTNSDATTKVLKKSETTAASDKNVKHNVAPPPGFSSTSVTTALNPPAWPSLSSLPFPTLPNHSTIPQPQAPYHPQALNPSFGCYSKQAAPCSTEGFQPPYNPVWKSSPLVHPGYPHQQKHPPAPFQQHPGSTTCGKQLDPASSLSSL